MPDMQPCTRRVGEHVEGVVLGLVRSVFRPKGLFTLPVVLPFFLDGGKIVFLFVFGHDLKKEKHEPFPSFWQKETGGPAGFPLLRIETREFSDAAAGNSFEDHWPLVAKEQNHHRFESFAIYRGPWRPLLGPPPPHRRRNPLPVRLKLGWWNLGSQCRGRA